MPDILPEEVSEGVFYNHHPHHRNWMANKSQWQISLPEETECFRHALDRGWLLDTVGWGFHFQEGSVECLGVGQDHATRVFVAKFVDNNNEQSWHGYPADHQKNSSDIPLRAVLRMWLEGNILGPAKIRKLSKGQPCSL